MDKVIEKCLERFGNRYLLVALAAKRARQLVAGYEPLIESKRSKATTLALEEIAEGKVSIESDEDKD